MTDGRSAALLGLLRNVLGMCLCAIWARLHLGAVLVKHMSFDADLREPCPVVKTHNYAANEVDKPASRKQFNITVTRLLCDVATTIGFGNGWDVGATELTGRTTPKRNNFYTSELCCSRPVEELAEDLLCSTRRDERRPGTPVNSHNEIRTKVLASQSQSPPPPPPPPPPAPTHSESQQWDWPPPPPALPPPPLALPTSVSHSLAGSAASPRPVLAPAPSLPDIQTPPTKPSSTLHVSLGSAGPEVNLHLPVISHQVKPWHLAPSCRQC